MKEHCNLFSCFLIVSYGQRLLSQRLIMITDGSASKVNEFLTILNVCETLKMFFHY